MQVSLICAPCHGALDIVGTAKLKSSPCKYKNHQTQSRERLTVKLNKNDELVIAALKPMGATELTMQELADKTGLPPKKVFKILKKFFEHEMIDSKARKYKLLTDKPPADKGKEDVPATEED